MSLATKNNEINIPTNTWEFRTYREVLRVPRQTDHLVFLRFVT